MSSLVACITCVDVPEIADEPVEMPVDEPMDTPMDEPMDYGGDMDYGDDW